MTAQEGFNSLNRRIVGRAATIIFKEKRVILVGLDNRLSFLRGNTTIANTMWEANHRAGEAMSAKMGGLPNIPSRHI